MAWTGLRAPQHDPDSRRCAGIPSSARVANQTIMIGPKTDPMPGGAAALHDEQRDQDRHRDRHDERLEDMGRDAETFDRAQHRDRRRDHAVAVEQRRAEETDRNQRAAGRRRLERISATSARMPPFALVVGAHDEEQVLAPTR